MYPHILSKLNRSIWAATPQTIEAVRDLLQSRMAQARIDLDQRDLPKGRLMQPSAAAQAFFAGDSSDRRDKKPYAMHGRTAVVPVFGVIGKHLSWIETFCGGVDVDAVGLLIETAVSDEDVDQVVAWFHTPGGVVTGVPETARKLAGLNAEKPIYAYTDGMCCSAGYWLASQCENIFASPSSDVGSIGVYLSWINAREHYEENGLHLELFKAGEFKAMGHPLKDVSETEARMLQDDVDAIWAQFKAAVTARRSVEESTMQGQCFGYQAQIETGLVDAHYDSIGQLLAELDRAS